MTMATSSKALEFKYSPKILDTLAIGTNYNGFESKTFNRRMPAARLIVLEGVIRSAKTATAIELFDFRVRRQTAPYALIAAEDYNAIRDNLLNSDMGLLKRWPDRYRLQKDEIGGYYIQVIGKDIRILLAGYSDVSKWKKILGKDIETIYVDEVNIADEQFINECFARQSATLCPLTIWTLNGDDPSHYIYKNWINKCIIIGDCPASIRAEMDKPEERDGKHVIVKSEGYYYFHWNFDDNPKLTAKMKQALASLFPVGSYYHKTRVLGERGRWGKMIFADYLSPEQIVNIYAKDQAGKPIYNITKYAIGFDVAENRAKNVIALIGFDCIGDYFYNAFVADLDVFSSMDGERSKGYSYKTQRLKAFLESHRDKFIEGVFVDSAENNYIQDLKSEQLRVPVAACYKATIKERIDLIIILSSQHRLFFNVQREPNKVIDCLAAYDAYNSAVWVKGKEGKEREDRNLPMNDIMDAIEYGLAKRMSQLLRTPAKRITR